MSCDKNVLLTVGQEPVAEHQGRWRVFSLLLIAAPVLKNELMISPAQMGLLFSAFFWSYAAFLIVAGWLADRYKVKLVLGMGYLVWSLATAGMGFVATLH